jgi:hypothetical protein
MRGEMYTGFWAGKPKENRTLGRPRCTWEYNIKMDPQKEGRNMDWINLVQNIDRRKFLVNAVMNLRVP